MFISGPHDQKGGEDLAFLGRKPRFLKNDFSRMPKRTDALWTKEKGNLWFFGNV